MSSTKKRSRLRRILEEYTDWITRDTAEANLQGDLRSYVDAFMEYKGLTEVKPSTPAEIARVTEILAESGLLRNCVSCEHFDLKLEMCKLVKMRPPAKTIALGCNSWQTLPF